MESLTDTLTDVYSAIKYFRCFYILKMVYLCTFGNQRLGSPIVLIVILLRTARGIERALKKFTALS